MTWKIQLALICDNNIWLSMLAERYLYKKGYDIRTFGVNDRIEVEVLNPFDTNFYNFGTTYKYIYKDLKAKRLSQNLGRRDRKKYKWLLKLLKENNVVKPRPERFQDCNEQFEIILTLDRKIFSKVVNHLRNIGSPTGLGIDRVHVFNLDLELKSKKQQLDVDCMRLKNFCRLLEKFDFEEDLFDVVDAFEGIYCVPLLYFTTSY